MKRIKKGLVIVLFVSISFISGILISYNYMKPTKAVESSSTTSTVSFNSIAMMLETEAGSGEYYLSTDSTWPDESEYILNESISKCENGSTVSWDSGNNQVIMTGTKSDKCYIYFDVYVEPTYSLEDLCTGLTLTDCIINKVYTTDGENGLYYFDGEGDYTNSSQEYKDYRYIYSGGTDDVNNFICIGDDCTDSNNLYRIIGLYLNDEGEYEAKVMKYEYYGGTYAWGSGAISEYNNSYLYSLLNTRYWDSLGNYSQLIASHTYNVPLVVGGEYTALEHISYINDSTMTTDEIALIYDSDFGYAASSSYWLTNLDSYNTSSENDWILDGNMGEYTLSYYYYNNMHDYVASSLILSGSITYANVVNASTGMSISYYTIRPTFYLNDEVAYVSGTGEKSSPIVVSLTYTSTKTN